MVHSSTNRVTRPHIPYEIVLPRHLPYSFECWLPLLALRNHRALENQEDIAYGSLWPWTCIWDLYAMLLVEWSLNTTFHILGASASSFTDEASDDYWDVERITKCLAVLVKLSHVCPQAQCCHSISLLPQGSYSHSNIFGNLNYFGKRSAAKNQVDTHGFFPPSADGKLDGPLILFQREVADTKKTANMILFTFLIWTT